MRHKLLWVIVTAITCIWGENVLAATTDQGNLRAKQLLHQAVQLGAELDPPGIQIDLYKTIAEEFAAMGAAPDANRLAEYFDVKRARDLVLLSAVRGSLKGKHLDQGIELAKLITEEYERGWALAYIARSQAEEGYFQAAQETLAEMKSGTLAEHALGEIIPLMVKAGRVRDAIQAALDREDDHSKGQVISMIVRAQFHEGDIEAAHETATAFSSKINDQWPLLTLSEVEAETGHFQEAEDIASKLKDPLRYFALGHIAESLANHGEFSKALDMAKSIPSPMHRYEDSPSTHFRAIGEIAIVQARKGYYKEALSTARLIPRQMSACDICEGYRDEIVSHIGIAQAQRGDLGLALQTAEKLKKSTAYYGDEVIKSVIFVHTRKGQIEAAIRTSKRFRSHDYRASTYQTIAEDWTRRDGEKGVMKWASDLSSRLEKAYVSIGIARAVLDKSTTTGPASSIP
jgi:tetratricopeptide (TPR) repeat protein